MKIKVKDYSVEQLAESYGNHNPICYMLDYYAESLMKIAHEIEKISVPSEIKYKTLQSFGFIQRGLQKYRNIMIATSNQRPTLNVNKPFGYDTCKNGHNYIEDFVKTFSRMHEKASEFTNKIIGYLPSELSFKIQNDHLEAIDYIQKAMDQLTIVQAYYTTSIN